MRIFQWSTAFICASFLLLASCTKIYFQEPQPVDSKELAQFPKELRGSWSAEGGVFKVSKFSFQIFESKVRTIELQDLEPDFIYKIVDSTIYIDDGGDVIRGTVLTSTFDEVSYRVEELEQFSLTTSGSLRKLGKDYILSMRNNDSQWWELYWISINKNKDIIVRSINSENSSFFKQEEILMKDRESNLYVSTQWTSKMLQEHISNGLFSDTAIVLLESTRIK